MIISVSHYGAFVVVYSCVVGNRSSYLELNDIQLMKLKQLTILSVAAKQKVW